MRDELLFYSKVNLDDLIRAYPKAINDEVDKWPRDYVLATPEADLTAYLSEKYFLDSISIREEDLYIASSDETKIDVSGRIEYLSPRDGGPNLVTGQAIVIALPFEGDPDILSMTTNPYTSSPPRGHVSGQEIRATFADVKVDATALKNKISRWFSDIKQCCDWSAAQCNKWNEQLPRIIEDAISSRKKRILAQADIVSALGIPMKRATNESLTFATPKVQRKLPIRPPARAQESFKPEPEMPYAEYEHVLELIQSVSVVFERSPTTFKKLGEEQLRDHILVVLNGHYESSTGETFNGDGKTDILVRVDGKNAFIGECKIWTGQKAVLHAIDQLLGYLTWRDTKAALIFFFRGKNFTDMTATMRTAVADHPNFKREDERSNETIFRCVLKQNTDEAREIHLASMAFHIPN